MGACAITPKVHSKEGKIVDSRLFNDLLSFLSNNRTRAVDIYKRIKGVDLSIYKDKFIFDDNNEPTIKSLIQNTSLKYEINEPVILKKLNRDIGHFEEKSSNPKLTPKTEDNYNKLLQKAREFNTKSDFSDGFIALVKNIEDPKTNKTYYNIEVEKRTAKSTAEYKSQEYNVALNSRLREILASHGVAIGALTELEKRLGVNGVTDFSLVKTAANGIIELIRLADGVEGEKALPEEFAHFAIAALGEDNPLVSRLINLIVSNRLAKEILSPEYSTYSSRYNKDEVKLAKEAIGKLLAKHLLQHESIPQKPYKNILQRVISSIKNFFKNISADSIHRAMIQADKEIGTLAGNILEGKLDASINIKNIAETTEFYNITERIARDKKILQSIIDTELKRLAIYQSRTISSSFEASQTQLITGLEDKIRTNEAVEGIYSYLDECTKILGKLSTRLTAVASSTDTINNKARVLRDIRNYIHSYKSIIPELTSAIIDEEKLADNRYGDRVRVLLDKVTLLVGRLEAEYNKVAVPLFTDFIRPFVGAGITIPSGRFAGKVITAEDIVSYTEEDISFFDRWLDSAADSSSYQVKILDQIIKLAKGKARLSTIDYMKELQAAAVKLEQAGVKGTDWIFERDSKGNLTGRYIQEINYGLYYEAKRAEAERLKKKYGENPVGSDLDAYRSEWQVWFKNNTINDKPNEKYNNKVYENLNDAQRTFYKTIMDIKGKLDSLLPENYTSLENAVKIRKDLVERVKASEDVKSGVKQIFEAIKDQFIRRSDDTEMGTRATIKDFEGREVQVLPIYYTKLREGESANDMSTDIVGTLTAYAAMANDFNEMNNVVDALELGRDIFRDPKLFKINKTRGDKKLIEGIEVLGRKVESVVTKESGERRIAERIDDLFEMQVYNRYMADEGTFGKSRIDRAKTANFLNKVTSLNTLALNILSGISNVATGTVMMRIESIAKEFFTESDTLKADRIYGKELLHYLPEANSRVKTSKLALWGELFEVMQDFEQSSKEKDFNKKWFVRMFGGQALYILNNAGEHWMHHRTSLALAMNYKMRAPKDKLGNPGKLVSLWDAMEVVYIDPNNKALGAKLKVKKDYTKPDGSEFTEKDAIDFSKKVAAINQRMHGIYNNLDKSAMQRLALGRMAIIFRKWIKPSLNRRFKSGSYNFDLDSYTEGYYRVAGRFLMQIAKELKQGQIHIISNYRNLNKYDKANMRRAITEVAHYLAILGILALIDWDDKDRPWLVKMTEYQLRRLKAEIGILIPGKPMIDEGLKIIKSPTAAIQTVQSTLDLVGLLNPYNYSEESKLKSGPFKGKTKAYKLLMKSPLAPMRNTLSRGGDPDLAIPFFK